jgi:predicted alpha/beta-fold hydrolase
MSIARYAPPPFLFNGHLETIYPALLRQVPALPYQRERILTPDDDFLDLDWVKNGRERLVIISHGLEGNSHRPYVQGMAHAFVQKGFDVLAWNYRGCSGMPNKQIRFYHSGATDDLHTVVTYALGSRYTEISLIGFSLGGNLTLKYLGEKGKNTPVSKAVVFSVPLHLQSSCEKISEPSNFLYAHRFLRSLKKKVKEKAQVRPDLTLDPLRDIKTLLEFDDRYTAPLHGFADACDYYEKSSALYFLEQIAVPSLIVNAANDPFLSAACYPTNNQWSEAVTFEKTIRGGHVGFARWSGLYWSEERALRFINA